MSKKPKEPVVQSKRPTASEATAQSLVRRLKAHFGTNPVNFPVVEQEFAKYERATFQLALDQILSEQP